MALCLRMQFFLADPVYDGLIYNIITSSLEFCKFKKFNVKATRVQKLNFVAYSKNELREMQSCFSHSTLPKWMVKTFRTQYD